MRITMVIFLILLVVVGAAGAYAAVQGDPGPNAFADSCTSESDNITAPENCAGPPDNKYVELTKGGTEHSLLLDMGIGQEGTGNLIIYYKTEKNLPILVEFNAYNQNKIIPIEQHTVELMAGKINILIPYENAPTPYLYVRISASAEGKYKLDAIKTETHLPDSDRDGMSDVWELTYGLNPLLGTGNDGPNNDNDNDMLTNKEEFDHNINPNDPDTDGDTLPDEWELDYSLKPENNEGKHGALGDPDEDGLTNQEELFYKTNPQKNDSDKDDLKDKNEIQVYGTLPSNADSDDDGMKDGWEVTSRINPNSADGNDGKDGDPDQDGLLNSDEFKAKSNANNPDTDRDGAGDLIEVNLGHDPANWDDGDLDGDGLTNGDETNTYRTDVWKPDTDNDGLTDPWEIGNGLKATDATGINGADGDLDNDGVPNIREAAKGANPNISDTDKDGLPDAWEILHCLFPYDATGLHGPEGDPDLDGKTNFVEMGMESAPTIGCVP